MLGVPDIDGFEDTLGPEEPLENGDTDGDADVEAVTDGLVVAEVLGVPDADVLDVTDVVTAGDTLGQEDRVARGEGDPDADPDADADADAEAEPELLGFCE